MFILGDKQSFGGVSRVANHPFNYSGFGLTWELADVALQCGLGVLSKRGLGSSRTDSSDFRSHG